MQKIALALIVGLAGLFSAPAAEARSNQGPITYVAVATWTAQGNGTTPLGFFNHSGPLEIRVKRITLTNFSIGNVQGGLIPFHLIFVSSLVDGSDLNVSTFSLGGDIPPYPDSVHLSTSPTNPVFESEQEIPFVEGCTLNNDSTAGTALSAVCYEVRPGGRSLIFDAGANRGFIIEQKMFKTDITDGDVMVHIEFTAE